MTPLCRKKKPTLLSVFLHMKDHKLKTRIYIDGYNLYYGCLKRTPYKWLDLKTLFTKHILPSVHHAGVPQLAPSSAIKFFTAKIIANNCMDTHISR